MMRRIPTVGEAGGGARRRPPHPNHCSTVNVCQTPGDGSMVCKPFLAMPRPPVGSRHQTVYDAHRLRWLHFVPPQSPPQKYCPLLCYEFRFHTTNAESMVQRLLAAVAAHAPVRALRLFALHRCSEHTHSPRRRCVARQCMPSHSAPGLIAGQEYRNGP